MARGLNRRQIGVTEEMMATFGEIVLRMSHNHQIREGDPYREKDWDAIERHREMMGLSDAEIAERIGLSRNQVLYIRTLMERRRFRTGHYARLLELGGGKRFRTERFTPHLDHFRYSEDALELRAAMNYPPDRARDYVEKGWWRNETQRRYLECNAAERPDAPAFVLPDRTLNWKELRDTAERVAKGLWQLGLRPGDVVALQLPNIPEFAIANLAVTWFGGVVQTIHMPYRDAELQTLINHGRSRAIVCMGAAKDWSAAGAALEMQPQLPTLKHVIAVGETPDGAIPFAGLVAGDPDMEIGHEPSGADPHLLLYTSGTTSSPKGVPLNSHNMLSNARMSAPEKGLTADDRILSAAPFTHLYGLYAFHLGIVTGMANLLLPAFSPPALAGAIEEMKPTAVWFAPAHAAAMTAAGLIGKHDFGSMKMCLFAGSAAPPAMLQALQEAWPGCRVCQLWGMTELQAGMFTRPEDGIGKSAVFAGRASPGSTVRVADPETGEERPRGEEGEIQIRGPMVFPGYLRNREANETAFTADRFFKSGDLGYMDEDGFVAITGRIKDIINRGGVKFNPQDIENLLGAHPAIQMAAVAPVPHDVLGEQACAWIQLNPGAEAPDLETLCAFLMEHRIARNKLPEKLVVVDEFPMTPTRKIIKGRLKAPAD